MGAGWPMKVIWSAASVRRLLEGIKFRQGESTGAAIALRRRILETVRQIGQMPYFGHAGRIEGTREVVVPRSSCSVVYQISGQTIEVLGLCTAHAYGLHRSEDGTSTSAPA
jgi:toxin ParE1/3/4